MNTLKKCFEKIKKIIFEEKQILDLLATSVFLLGKVNKTQINYIFSEKKLPEELNDTKIDEINPYFGMQICNSEQELETVKIGQVFIYEIMSILAKEDLIMKESFSLWYEEFLLQNKDQNKREKFLKSWISNSCTIDLEKHLLKEAFFEKNFKFAKWLIDRSIDTKEILVFICNSKENLHLALSVEQKEIIYYMFTKKDVIKNTQQISLEKNDKIRILSNDGSTALHTAAKKGDTKTVLKLINAKANVNAKNKDEIVALTLAAEIKKK